MLDFITKRLFRIELDQCEPFDDREMAILRGFLHTCKNIQELPDVKYYWCDELADYAFRGAFVTYYPDIIFLSSIPDPMDHVKRKNRKKKSILKWVERLQVTGIKEVIPIVVHEHTHYWQYHRDDDKNIIRKSLTRGGYHLKCGIRPLYNCMLDAPAYRNEVLAAAEVGLDPGLYGKPLE